MVDAFALLQRCCEILREKKQNTKVHVLRGAKSRIERKRQCKMFSTITRAKKTNKKTVHRLN